MSRTAIISGASRGIGFSTALELGRQGWNVVLTGTVEERLRSALATLSRESIPCHAITFSVDDSDGWDRAVRETTGRFGGVDALVCNAGISPRSGGRKIPFDELDPLVWRQTMQVNVEGAVLGARAVTPKLKSRHGSSITFVSSIAGRVGMGFVSSYYTTSKTALIGLMRGLAHDLGPYGIRVNAVAPGRIDTEMTRQAGRKFNDRLTEEIALRRVGNPEEVASVIAFLASDAASYVTGACIDVHGGWVMS